MSFMLLGILNAQGAGAALSYWLATLGGADREEGFSITTDSLGNSYELGITNSTGAGGYDFLLAKYDQDGIVQWQRVIGGAGGENGYGVAVDSSDNVYAAGYTTSAGAGGADFLIAKYNSSGTIQWQRVLGGAGNDSGQSVAIDSADNVYVLGFTLSAGAGSLDFLLAKYNSSGTIQWQRVLGTAGSYENGRSVAVDLLDNVYVFGVTGGIGEGGDEYLQAKLPNDGSLTGTYALDGVDVVYAASSLTAATSTLTAATSSLTAATSSLTAATSTLTAATSSLTSATTSLTAATSSLTSSAASLTGHRVDI